MKLCGALFLVTSGCGDDSGSGSASGSETETDSATDTGDDGDGSDDGSASADDDGTGSASASGTSSSGDDDGSGSAEDSTGTSSGTGSTGGTGTTGGGTRCDGLDGTGLILHTTLDDAASVNAPAVGNGMGQVNTTPPDDFVPALSGNGIQIDAGNENVEFPQTTNMGANVDLMQGTVDFCYQPFYDSDSLQNGDEFGFFAVTDAGQGWIRMRVSDSNNALQAIALPPGPNPTVNEINIPTTNFRFQPGEWYRVTISWDFTVGNSERNMYVYLDGVEATPSTTPMGPLGMGNPSPNGDVIIGAIPANSWHANGVIDDFKLYDSARVP